MDTGLRKSSRVAEKLEAANKIIRLDPRQVLPVEIFEMTVKMCCSDSLSNMRLVNESWKRVAETSWRELQLTVIHFTRDSPSVVIQNTKKMTMEEFLKEIKEPLFKYKVKPFKRFYLSDFPFHKKKLDTVKYFMKHCLPAITHVTLADTFFKSWDQFSDIIFKKLKYLQHLALVRPGMQKQPETAYQRKLEFPPNPKLTHFTVDFTDNTVARFLLPKRYLPLGNSCPWKTLLSSWANLKTMEILLDEEHTYSLDIRTILQAVNKLSNEGKLRQLKHFLISLSGFTFDPSRDIEDGRFHFEENPNFTEMLANLFLCELNLTNLEIQIDYQKAKDAMPGPIPPTGDIETKVADKFHITLERLMLFVIHESNQQSEFPQLELPHLTKLSISYSLAQSLRSAEYLSKLEQLEILSRPRLPHDKYEPSESDNIKWLNEHNFIADPSLWDDRSQIQQDTKDNPLLDPDYILEGDSMEDDSTFVEHPLHHLIKTCDDETHGPASEAPGFLFSGSRLCNESITFENVTRFRMEHGCSCKVFTTLSNWMPNVTALEIRLPGCSFPLLCEKWGKLEKLTLLMKRHPDNDCKTFIPVDDCVITGQKHLSRPELKCTFESVIGFQSGNSDKPPINWSYFRRSDASRSSNITNLQNLRYFKMEHEKYFLTDYPVLSDESVYNGFYKLPKLEYLEIVADLNVSTIAELFKRVPRCVIYRPKCISNPGLQFYARKNLTVVPTFTF